MPEKDDERREELKKHGDSVFRIIGIIATTIVIAWVLMIAASDYIYESASKAHQDIDEAAGRSYPEYTPPPPAPWSPKPPSTSTPTPIPTKKLPYHADGDPRKCGTCHTYPDTTYRIHPKPTPTKTSQYDPPYYVIPSNTVPIPDNYYSQPCELPTDQSMQEYLANSDWLDDYDVGGWDCSQMAVYMEFMLENCGYHTVIREADMEGEQYGHAWILVEFKQGWLAYECTGRYWVYPDEATAKSYDPYGTVHWNPSKYDAGVQYESIYDIWDGYKWYGNGEAAFLKECGWWAN